MVCRMLQQHCLAKMVREVRERILCIQRRFRANSEIMRSRRRALRDGVLAAEILHTVKALLDQKSNIEKFKELAAKITGLSDKKRDFVTDAFIHLAKADYRSRFLRWYAQSHPNKVDVETPEGLKKSRELEMCIEQANLTKLKMTEFVTAESGAPGGNT